MSIRFKFRSSVNFDAVEIGNRESITVGELRSRILQGKVSQQQQGFDLVFSDAVSGLEFKGDCEIPSGSSVIVKRVPDVTMPSGAVVPIEAVKHAGLKESHDVNLAKTGPKDDFNDIGVDLFAMPDLDLPSFTPGFDQSNFMGNKKDDVAVIPRGFHQHQNDKAILPTVDKQMKSNKLPTSNFLTVKSTNFPLELKCSLCNNFFTDAVMIPCCQHSFCEKCIHQVLIAKGMCPKCSSRKCTVGDLLPNLSLRQAIEHLLESQMFDAGFEGVMQKYVPDGESGIQVKDASCALTVAQRDLEAPQSSCATGKGSNQVLVVSSYEQQQKRNIPYGNLGSRYFDPSCKENQLYPHSHEDFAQSTDFQGENQPVLPEAHGEADSSAKKRKGGFWIGSGVEGRNPSGFGGYRKVVRNCYACGSPDHLMRDCPVSHQNPMFQSGCGALHGGMPGYAPPYWNGFSYPPFTVAPYANMYSIPSMMPFNPSIVPVPRYAAVPPYISSVGGSLPGPGGNMRTGNMEPPRFDQFGLQPCGNKRKKLSSENPESDQHSDNMASSSECYRHYSPQKTYYHKSQKDKEQSSSHSDNSLAQRSGRKHHHEKYNNIQSDERHEKSHHSFGGREKRLSHVDRSTSVKDGKSISNEWHREGRHKRHHGDTKKDDERRRGHSDSDPSLGRPSTHKGVKRRVDSNVQDSARKLHHSRSETDFEPRTPADRRAQYKDRDAGRDYYGLHAKHVRERHHGDRLQVVQEDCRDEHHHHKRRGH